MGFQHMKRPILEAASRKGGKIRVDKGFAKNKELAREAGAKGGKAKYENQSRGIVKTQKDSSNSGVNLADIFGDLDEQIQE